LLDAPVCHIDDYSVSEILLILRGVAMEVDVDHVENCSVCEIRYLCGGMCRVLQSRKTGTRLLNTCNSAEKDRKYRNLVSAFAVEHEQ